MRWPDVRCLLALAGPGCLPHRVPESPTLADWSWQVDRSALPPSTLRVVHVATDRITPAQARAGGDGPAGRAPISVWVLSHPTAGLVLIDAGFGRRTLDDPNDYPGRLSAKLLDLQMRRPAVDALADLGLGPDDVHHVVLTHAHTDHVGGVEDFPAATVHADPDEWAAGSRRRATRGYDPKPYEGREAVPVRWVDQPYGPFERHADLLGDGQVILLPAPGHTVGSLMVLLNLPGGSVLLTGDAAWVDDNWRLPAPKGWLPRVLLEQDWRREMDGLWRVRAWHERHPDLAVHAGHEPENLSLPDWPAPVLQ